MELTSKDGNMVVDFYPIKDWNNNIDPANRILKVLRFKGDQQKKMLISKEEFDSQVKEYVNTYKYKITWKYMPAQYYSEEVIL